LTLELRMTGKGAGHPLRGVRSACTMYGGQVSEKLNFPRNNESTPGKRGGKKRKTGRQPTKSGLIGKKDLLRKKNASDM